jgi:hypothetical protein
MVIFYATMLATPVFYEIMAEKIFFMLQNCLYFADRYVIRDEVLLFGQYKSHYLSI